MPDYLEHYHLHNSLDYYEHIRSLHEAAGTAGPADAPDILEDLLHLQKTREGVASCVDDWDGNDEFWCW